MTFSPETSPADAQKISEFLRGLNNTDLDQAIAFPPVLVGRLPALTINHMGTAAERVIVELAKTERQRRQEDRVDQRSRNAFWVSIGSLVIAALALAVSIISILRQPH